MNTPFFISSKSARGESVSRSGFILGGLLLLMLSSFARAAVTVSVSPTNIMWDANTWVQLDITGLTTNQRVNLTLHADIDKNGVAGPTEPQIMRFGLRDGMANSFGAQVIVCDTNGVSDGAIHARVSYHGLSGESVLWHAAGQYVWKVTATNGANLASATFTVTPPESTVCITGAVKVVTSLDPLMGTPLPGALVAADLYSYCQGYMPAVWSDTAGNFLLPVPAGISNDNVQSVSAVAFGYCMAENGPEGVGSLSTVPLQEVL